MSTHFCRIALFLMLALMLALLQHRMRVLNTPFQDGPYAAARIGEFRSEAPYQRRVLVPWVAVQLRNATGVSLDSVIFGLRLLSLCVIFPVFYSLNTALLGNQRALSATLLLAGLLPFGFFISVAADSLPSLAILVTGLWCIQFRKDWWLLPLVAIGSFVRETTLFLIVIYFLTHWQERREKRHLALFVLLPLLYIGVRGFLKWQFPGPDSIFSLWYNLFYLLEDKLFFLPRLLMVVLPFLLGYWGLKRARGLARPMAGVALCYAPVLLAVAHIDGPRVFYESWALMIPSIIAAVSEDSEVSGT